MGNQPVDVRRGSIYVLVIRASPEVVSAMSGVEFKRVRVAEGMSSLVERAAFKDSPFGVAGIDGVIPMVNKDIIGEVCCSLDGSACSGEKFGRSNMLKSECLM